MSQLTPLQQIRRLEPEKDHQRICHLSGSYEFPFDLTRSLELALFRTFCSPSISAVLDSTGESHHRAQKRYDDTDLIISEMLEYGHDSERGRAALRRMSQLHGHYVISNSDFLSGLSTFVFEPIRWMDRNPTDNQCDATVAINARPRYKRLHQSHHRISAEMCKHSLSDNTIFGTQVSASCEVPDLARIRTYYDETWLDYRLLWLNPEHCAIHFGYWDENTHSHAESLSNINRELANRIGIQPGQRILDADCGVGGSAIWVAKAYDVEVVGITPVTSQVRRAQCFARQRGVADRVSFARQDYTLTHISRRQLRCRLGARECMPCARPVALPQGGTAASSSWRSTRYHRWRTQAPSLRNSRREPTA